MRPTARPAPRSALTALRRRPRTPAAEAFAAAGPPLLRTPWREARWCALDLELTGLDPAHDHIIAIGAVPIQDGRLQLGRSFYTLVHSARRSQPGAILTHKLRTADVAEAPSLQEALEQTLEVMTGAVPVFHFAAVERAFLSPQFKALRVALPDAVDTEALGRHWLHLPGGSLSLSALADRLGQRAEPAHHALGDALTTAQAFIALAGLLDAGSPQTVGTLLTHSRR